MPSSRSQISTDVLNIVTKLVRRNCVKFRFNGKEEDIRQDILVKLLVPSQNVGTTYLERFDPSKNSLEGFLSRLIFNYFCRLFSRGKHAIEQAKNIDDIVASGEGDSLAELPVYHDSSIANKMFLMLEERYPYTSGVLYEPPVRIPAVIIRVVTIQEKITAQPGQEVLWRSVANIFNLMLTGFSQEEVASLMHVSKGWISKQVHKIRQQDEIIDWADEFGLVDD